VARIACEPGFALLKGRLGVKYSMLTDAAVPVKFWYSCITGGRVAMMSMNRPASKSYPMFL